MTKTWEKNSMRRLYQPKIKEPNYKQSEEYKKKMI